MTKTGFYAKDKDEFEIYRGNDNKLMIHKTQGENRFNTSCTSKIYNKMIDKGYCKVREGK
jgi:hypothetical protein